MSNLDLSDLEKQTIRVCYKTPKGILHVEDRGVDGVNVIMGRVNRTLYGRERLHFLGAITTLQQKQIFQVVLNPSQESGVTYELTLKGWELGDLLFSLE